MIYDNDDDAAWLDYEPPAYEKPQAKFEGEENIPPYSTDSMRELANENLHTLLARMKQNPQAYKATEIITAAREALDRVVGKAAQSVTIDNKSTVTHEYIVKIAPDEAYRRMIEGDLRVIEHDK